MARRIKAPKPPKFVPAPEATDIGRDLIHNNYPELYAQGVRVDFIFTNDNPRKGGQDVWGTARKVGGLNAFLSGTAKNPDDLQEFFVITLTKQVFDRLPQTGKVALVHHELMHCKTVINNKGKTTLKLVTHDFEGFTEEIKRYGLWRPNAAAMATAMQNQPVLPFDEPVKTLADDIAEAQADADRRHAAAKAEADSISAKVDELEAQAAAQPVAKSPKAKRGHVPAYAH